MHAPPIWIGLLPVSGAVTFMHFSASNVFIPFSHEAHVLPLSLQTQNTISGTHFDAFIGCDTFGTVLFTVQHHVTAILKEADPIVSPSLFSSTTVFSFLFSLHLFICPLIHLSSHFLLSSSPLFPRLPFITVLCDTYLVAASHLPFYCEKGKATKHNMWELRAFVCVLIGSHLIIHKGSDHHSQFSYLLG